MQILASFCVLLHSGSKNKSEHYARFFPKATYTKRFPPPIASVI